MASKLGVVVFLTLLLSGVSSACGLVNDCDESSVALQVLGSGGPFPRDGRASSSYLVWIGGRARVMIDAGGGAFVRFGESGARVEDLSLVAISHFHPDHVSDLPALLWVSNVLRHQSLPISGPSGDEVFPGVTEFLSRLFGERSGAFPILSWTLGGDAHYFTGVFPLEVTSVDVAKPQPTVVLDTDELKVSAMGVPHNAPTLAYRVEVGEVSIVFSSDQNGSDPRFVDFAGSATVLVMHMGAETGQIHARPSVVGQIARDAKVETLVLSHLSGVERDHPRFKNVTLGDLAGNVAVVERIYAGPIIQAEDLQCIAIVE